MLFFGNTLGALPFPVAMGYVSATAIRAGRRKKAANAVRREKNSRQTR
jgi:hypothetical protein